MADCIPKHVIDKIREDLESGKLSPAKLYNMPTSKARRKAFEKYMPESTAKWFNVQFESAAASSNRKALISLFTKLPTEKGEGQKTQKDLLAKIKQLEDAGLVNTDEQTATFTDLVQDRLGLSVTPTELQNIVEHANEVEARKTELAAVEVTARASKLPAKQRFVPLRKATVAYNKALTSMDKYMNSLVPTHKLKVVTGTIFRGNMLLNIPPAFINLISNTVQGMMQAGERRLATGQLAGSNTDLAIEYAKMVVEVYHKTGRDISRQYAEDIRLGEKTVHNEGKGIVRKTGRGISTVVFKYMLGYADVISAAVASADSTNVASAKIAKVNGLKGEAAKQNAEQIFMESISTVPNFASPVAKDAEITRTQAIADAEFATWTNKGWLADRSIGLRNWLNDATGDLQLGFWNMPFIKTGANVIQFGLESSPLGVFPFAAKLRQVRRLSKDPAAKKADVQRAIFEMARSGVRLGMGSTLSFILAAMIPPDDFFSAYESTTQKQRDLLGIKKGVYNAVKIGDYWISLDFFGPLGAGFVGMLYAKKYGKGATDTAFKAVQGIGSQALQVPGLQDFEGLYKSLKDILAAEPKEALLIGAASSINSIRARAIPGILNTFAKATDVKVRKIDREDMLSRFKAGVPGLRKGLQAKVDITTGEEVEGAGPIENFLLNMFTGSRIKKANQNAIIDEFSRLEREGQAPTMSDIERSSSKVQGLKQQVSSDKFQDALKWFGKEYGRKATRLLKTSKYKRASDEDKRDLLNEVRTDVRAMMLRRFGYRKPRRKGRQVRK